MTKFNNLEQYHTLTDKDLVETKGGELGTLIALFATTYVIGSDLARRKK